MKDLLLTVTKSERVAPNVCRMTLAGEIGAIVPGQFAHVAVPGFLLRRPFCITAFGAGYLEIVFAIVGKGTAALAGTPVGTQLQCIAPIGNGFSLAPEHKRILIVGGGLGVAPLLPVLATHTDRDYRVLLGFGTASAAVELDDFRALCADVTVATDDGTLGVRGRVTDLVPQAIGAFSPDCILCCGPTPMLRALQAIPRGVPTFASTEARMGCGVGACLVCVCPVKRGEVVRNLRVCIDGPVFSLDELVL